jgi:ABC-type Fe3+/spermidine/putrescine transport system ATPase subunit
MEPEVLLLDEPLSNLDAKLRMNIRAELRQLQKRLGITTIYVTHDQAEALALSDQIAVMSKGEIIQVGSPWEIYYRPKNVFVADFVGTANMVDGKVSEKHGNTYIIDIDGASLEVEEADLHLSTGEEVTLCIRPETIRVSEPAGEPAPNSLRGVIRNHIFEGAQVRYWVEAGSREFIVDVFDPSDRGIYTGEVEILVAVKKVHILTGTSRRND